MVDGWTTSIDKLNAGHVLTLKRRTYMGQIFVRPRLTIEISHFDKNWEVRWGRDWDTPPLPFDWWIYEDGEWLGAVTRVGSDRLYRLDLPKAEPIFGDFGNVRSELVELRRKDQVVGKVREVEDKTYAWEVDIEAATRVGNRIFWIGETNAPKGAAADRQLPTRFVRS